MQLGDIFLAIAPVQKFRAEIFAPALPKEEIKDYSGEEPPKWTIRPNLMANPGAYYKTFK